VCNFLKSIKSQSLDQNRDPKAHSSRLHTRIPVLKHTRPGYIPGYLSVSLWNRLDIYFMKMRIVNTKSHHHSIIKAQDNILCVCPITHRLAKMPLLDKIVFANLKLELNKFISHTKNGKLCSIVLHLHTHLVK
jgi:hypothetical protein